MEGNAVEIFDELCQPSSIVGKCLHAVWNIPRALRIPITNKESGYGFVIV